MAYTSNGLPSVALSVAIIAAAAPSNLSASHPLPLAGTMLFAHAAQPTSQNEAAHTHLKQIFELQENWDGYGAMPIHAETKHHAQTALMVFTQLDIVPDITPNPNGTLSFEWATDRGTAHLELGRQRYVAIVRPNGLAAIPFSGWASNTNTLFSSMQDLASYVVAALIPPQSPTLSVKTYAAINARAAA